MSPRETAIELIQEIPDDKIIYVLNIIRGINGLYRDTNEKYAQRQEAFRHLQQMRGRIPGSLDYDEELAKARIEKYAAAN